MEKPMVQVALAWALQQPGISSLIIGASKPEQLADNIESLNIKFTSEQLDALNEASKPAEAFPYGIFTPSINKGIFGGATVKGWG